MLRNFGALSALKRYSPVNIFLFRGYFRIFKTWRLRQVLPTGNVVSSRRKDDKPSGRDQGIGIGPRAVERGNLSLLSPVCV